MHFDLQEEVQSLQDGTYAIQNELSVRNARPGQVEVALDGEFALGCAARMEKLTHVTRSQQAPLMR